MARPELLPEDLEINDPLDLHPLFARYSKDRSWID
jgi:hypothetical protein